MPRGRTKKVGDQFTNANGYTYEKTESRGWLPKHLLIAEQFLGRELKAEEKPYFVDGDRSNLSPDNIRVRVAYDKKTPQAQLVIIEADIADLQDRLTDLLERREKLRAQIASEV